MARGGISCLTSISMMQWLELATGLVHVVATSVHPYVQLSYCIQKIPCFLVVTHLWLLYSSCHPLMHNVAKS